MIPTGHPLPLPWNHYVKAVYKFHQYWFNRNDSGGCFWTNSLLKLNSGFLLKRIDKGK